MMGLFFMMRNQNVFELVGRRSWCSSSSNNIGGAVLHNIKEQFRAYEGGRVNLRKEQNIAFIEIDHAEKKNGLSGKMMTELHDSILELEHWTSGKALILYGAASTFCSGGFLPTVKQICNPKDGYRMSTLMHDTVLRLRSLPLVSVSLICGKAIGGGAELALATDFRLMSSTAQIKFVEARMGVGTGWGGGTLLQRLVGRGKALELLLTCRGINVEEATKLGLVDGVVEVGKEMEGAVEWIGKLIGEHHASVVRCVKGIVDCDDFEEERRVFAESWGGEVQKQVLSNGRVVKHH